MRKFIAIALLIWLLFSPAVFAERNITLPFELDFDSNNYSDLVWVSGGGGSHTWLESGGWSGGAAKFTPPTATSDQYYVGLGSFNSVNSATVHIRFLVKMGSAYESTAGSNGWGYQNKFVIVEPDSGDRGMTIFERYSASPYYYTWGCCTDNTCFYENGDWWPDGTDAFKSTDYQNEWYCVELEVNATANTTRVYIWTQDGEFDGSYLSGTLSTGSSFSSVQIIGGYYNGHHTADEDCWVMFDELVIDDEYIGPPEGFLSGETPQPTTQASGNFSMGGN